MKDAKQIRQNAISTERQTLVCVLICSNKHMRTSNYSTVMKFSNRNQHFWVSRSAVTDTEGRTAPSKSQAKRKSTDGWDKIGGWLYSERRSSPEMCSFMYFLSPADFVHDA